jgi:hypothetical protein
MDAIRLDRIVAEARGKTIPLALDTRARFVCEAKEFFKAPNNNARLFTRSRDLNPPGDFSPWKDRGIITVTDVEDDRGYAVYIKFASGDDLFIDQDAKGRLTGYIFVPEVGFYLHQQAKYWEREQILILPE